MGITSDVYLKNTKVYIEGGHDLVLEGPVQYLKNEYGIEQAAFMLEHFIQQLNLMLELSPEDQDLARRVVRIREFGKGEFLLQEGQISTAFFFNLKGMVRLFYVKGGVETTTHFYPENTFISAYKSYIRQLPTRINFQATEATTVVEITREAAFQLLDSSPSFDAMARIAMEEELSLYQDMIANLLTLTPEERYYDLMESQPAIFQRVPQHIIATYIGVKPESLSRIKKRHLERNLNQSQ